MPASNLYPDSSSLNEAKSVQNLMLLAELDRAAGMRIRDVRLSEAMQVEYESATWRDYSRATVAWLKTVMLLNVLSCAIDYVQEPNILWLGVLMRIAFLPTVYVGLAAVWARPRPSWVKGLTLPAAVGALMIVAGVLGIVAGGAIYERYLTAGLAAAATAIVIFGVEKRWAIIAITVCLASYGGFGLCDPLVAPIISLVMTLYYGSLLACLVPARHAMNLIRLRSFMMTLRSRLQTEALSDANANLRTLACTDGLTGLSNRRAIEETMASVWTEQRHTSGAVGIILVDVDLFKHFNDSAGHQAGDLCLIAIAKAIANAMPDPTLAGRYGGEEFIAILPEATLRSVAATGEEIRASVAALRLLHPGLENSNVSVSVGVSLVVADGDIQSLQTAIRDADTALYRAKASGRNCVMTSWVSKIEQERIAI